MLFTFVGQSLEFNDPSRRNLERFGQTVELPEPEAQAMVLNGAPLIPSDLFKVEVQWTDAEAREYPTTTSIDFAPDATKAKRKAAWMALHQYRESLQAVPAPAPEIHEEA